MRRALLSLPALGLLGGCAIWPVNQDPAGMEYRREANRVIDALQTYRRDKGSFPRSLASLTPAYLPAVPDIPDLRYRATDGSLTYYYIPSWPQLRPVRCASVGNSTNWRCAEHLIDKPM